MRLLTIDPGIHTGIAFFRDAFLENCDLINTNTSRETVISAMGSLLRYDPSIAIVEIPLIYPQRVQKGDPNDLIQVAKIAGMFLGIISKYCAVEEVYPNQWKGQRPKSVDNKYTISKLGAQELNIFDKHNNLRKNLKHNIIDAIGIGLWKLRRR
jgi:hypothetical protein